MTDRISYLIVTSDAKGCSSAIRRMRGIMEVFDMEDGKLFVLLEKPVRDEDYFTAPMIDAIWHVRGVKNIEKHPVTAVEAMWNTTARRTIATRMMDATREVLVNLQPKLPSDSEDFAEFVANYRGWRDTTTAILDTALDAIENSLTGNED